MTIHTAAVRDLLEDLKKEIRGEIRFDRLTTQLYATDASDFRKVPIGVVIPRHLNDIQTATRIAAQHKIPIIPRGGGSSVSGQTVGKGLIIDVSKFCNKVLEFAPSAGWVEVEAGMVLDVLNRELAPHALMVGPDPSSSAVATLGGMAGNNTTGSHSFVHGMMADHIISMEGILSDGSRIDLGPKNQDQVNKLAHQDTLEGQIYRNLPPLIDRYAEQIRSNYPKTWRNVAGYGLDRMLKDREAGKPFSLAPIICGSEGTLATITKVRLRVVKRPQKVRLALLHFDDLQSCMNRVPLILRYPVSAVELMAHSTLRLAHDHPVVGPRLRSIVKGLPGAILIVELSGETEAELADKMAVLETALQRDGYRGHISHCLTPAEVGQVWHIRKSIFGLIVSKPGDDKPVWIIDDASVPVEELARYTDDVREIGQRFGIDISFDAHASAGCLHMGLDLNLKTQEGLKNLEIMTQEIMTTAIRHHGSTTGEHGEGLARSYFNEQLYGKELHTAFKEVKAMFDPAGLLNPNKVVNGIKPWDPEWLKYTPTYRTPYAPENTELDFSHYGGFAGMVEMCNGQGICRAQQGGTMCPSYRVTRDERDTTRGRANTLRAAMTGQFGPEGLSSKEVYETMSLCLACKACRSECSTRVDMAKLKYEFLSLYQQQHGIPLRSKMVGAMALTSRLGSMVPGVTNWLYDQQGFRLLLDKTLKIDRRRRLPKVATKSFRKLCGSVYSKAKPVKQQVILWDDCYVRYHNPELGLAAVKVLEALDYEVTCLKKRKCCGRPMISKGLLKEAKLNAHYNVKLLTDYARRGVPIVGVEPSCITCFRDEYPDLLCTDEAKLVGDNAFFLEEFLTRPENKSRLAELLKAPEKSRKVLVHSHCYQKSIGTAPLTLEMLGLLPDTEVDEIPSGCCGMAGAFGYEKEHYETSMAIGEQVLFPTIRAASKETTIIAAGTSCREQIKDGTSREAKHPIQMIADNL